MIFLGELADKNHGERIVSGLLDRGIAAHLSYMEERKNYGIFIERREDFSFALDFFEVQVGLKRPVFIKKEDFESWEKIKKIPMGFITKILLLVSIMIFIPLNFFKDSVYLESFYISQFTSDGILKEIMQGEIWRLVTPIFLHFGFIHLLFNMMWLKDLGSLVEHILSEKLFVYFVVSTAIFSNLLQYFVSGPRFGGMSGVIYGLLGFIWMMKKFSPKFEYGLPKSDIVLMVGWFFLCLSGVIGRVANMAHGGGLGFGMILGILMGLRDSRNKLFSVESGKYFLISFLIPVLTFFVEIIRR